jgi:hypothetical protein
MKAGNAYQELKVSCHDIGNIYRQNLENTISSWFTNAQKQQEAARIFEQLTDADAQLVVFVNEEILMRLNKLVEEAEVAVDTGDLDEAEKQRLASKIECKEVLEFLTRFSGEIADLVIIFSVVARVPITLRNRPL